MAFSNSNLTTLADQHTSALKEITYLKQIKKEMKAEMDELKTQVESLQSELEEARKKD